MPPSPLVRAAIAGTVITGVAALSACSQLRADRAVRVASGLTSDVLCVDTFISGLDPERTYAEKVRALHGMGLVAWGLRYQVDRQRHEVHTSIAGAFDTRSAYFDGWGCVSNAQDGGAPVSPGPWPALSAIAPALPEIAGPAPVTPTDPALQSALASAFDEPSGAATHRTKALLVMRDGHVVGERYAPGVGVDTPLLGFSMTKSTLHALIGVLVRQGRLRPEQNAPVPAWSDAADPRHAITIEQLLRQTSGLDLPQDNSGFDPTSQILFIARDKAAAAAAAPLAMPPGTRWAYTDTNSLLLSRILRDAVGGHAADVARFMHDELFAPLGMQHASIVFDATGTPSGASFMLASARDWARLGQLYLNDGMAGGQRILPEGWARQAAAPTLNTGYGMGFWTNQQPGLVPGWGVPWGLANAPRDAFFARGFMGQFTVVIPSRRMVIVRLSASSNRGDDIVETDRIVGEILAAMPGSP